MDRLNEPYPLMFDPVLKGYPWGGRKIAELLGRDTPAGPVAESWEISDHAQGRTAIANGPLAGCHLDRLLAERAELLLGARNRYAADRGLFPLLVKILDAREWLSVQVHPDDDHAAVHESDLGKTEMWIVLDAEPEAEVLLGLRSGIDEPAFRRAIDDGRTADCLHRVRAHSGDVFFVPPGTVHAIGPGLLLAEIQQSSNVTYRVFDWNRQPPRPLHIEESLAVLDFAQSEPSAVEPRPLPRRGHELLASCRYFRTERVNLAAGDELSGNLEGATFEIWGALSGEAEVVGGGESVALPGISWTLLPASLGAFRIRAIEETTLLRVLTPEQV